MENSNIKFRYIDLFKYFFSLCVVAIHIHPLVNVQNTIVLSLYNFILSLSVPFFFCSIGFFIEEKSKTNDKKIDIIKKNIKKYIKIYISFSIIYLPFAIYFFIHNNYNIFYSILDYLRGFFIIGENYNSWILWFILSAIYSLLLILFFIKNNYSYKKIFIISIILFLFGLFIDATISNDFFINMSFLSNTFKKVISTGRLFYSPLYIIIGMFISKNKNKTCKKNIYIIIFVLTIFFSFLIGNRINTIFIPIAIYSLFSFLTMIKKEIKIKTIGFRNLSKYLYFWHLFIWGLFSLLLYQGLQFGLVWYIITITIIHIMYLFIKLFKKKGCLA